MGSYCLYRASRPLRKGVSPSTDFETMASHDAGVVYILPNICPCYFSLHISYCYFLLSISWLQPFRDHTCHHTIAVHKVKLVIILTKHGVGVLQTLLVLIQTCACTLTTHWTQCIPIMDRSIYLTTPGGQTTPRLQTTAPTVKVPMETGENREDRLLLTPMEALLGLTVSGAPEKGIQTQGDCFLPMEARRHKQLFCSGYAQVT